MQLEEAMTAGVEAPAWGQQQQSTSATFEVALTVYDLFLAMCNQHGSGSLMAVAIL
jgi:hypothetical protein